MNSFFQISSCVRRSIAVCVLGGLIAVGGAGCDSAPGTERSSTADALIGTWEMQEQSLTFLGSVSTSQTILDPDEQ